MNIFKYRLRSMFVILSIFILVSIFLFVERMGIHHNASMFKDSYIKNIALTTNQVHETIKKTSLLITNTEEENSVLAAVQFRQILKDMKIGFDEVDVAKSDLVDFKDYETIIILLPNVSVLKDDIYNLVAWVKDGGKILFGLTLEPENYLSTIKGHLGIEDAGYRYSRVNEIYIDPEFMLGGDASYIIDEPYESAWSVLLRKDAKVYARTEGEKSVPLIWSVDYGKGRFVIDNFGLYSKNMRGLYAASYSLLEDQCIYPVINGQAYYIDDFPAPVSQGNVDYIRNDYGMNISEFYSKVWWPDMLDLLKDYPIKYSGGIIENYEGDTSGVIDRQRDTDDFIYYGNMLLAYEGELCYLGYNHQPLSLTNFGYGDAYSFNVWKNETAMEDALNELIDFSNEVYPNTHRSVYIPPANVLSKEGRKVLLRQGERIKSIASTYFAGWFTYPQEFEVADDGIIEQPRIVSGGLLSNYLKMAAFSELNMHYVSSHYIHPYDALDIKKGANKGWNIIYKGYRGYVDWIHESAPDLRYLTASQLASAVQRYGILSFNKENSEAGITIKINNFHDNAYFFMRFNEGKPNKISGGTLKRLTGNLYLLTAENEKIEIEVIK